MNSGLVLINFLRMHERRTVDGLTNAFLQMDIVFFKWIL